MTGANLGLSLTVNLEQYEDLAGHDDEAGVMVCIIILSFIITVCQCVCTWGSVLFLIQPGHQICIDSIGINDCSRSCLLSSSEYAMSRIIYSSIQPPYINVEQSQYTKGHALCVMVDYN